MFKTAAIALACVTLGVATFVPAQAEEVTPDTSISLELDGIDLGIDARRGGRGHDGRGHDGRHGGRPGWGGGWHGGRGDRPQLPPRNAFNACFASNARGVVFRASGRAPRWAVQDAAVRLCRRNSLRPNSCRPMGCR